MSLLETLLDRLSAASPLSSLTPHRMLLAVSGGADSVALLRLLVAWMERRFPGLPPSRYLTVAHFHHRLRGGDADQDLEFVSQLADRFGVPLKVGHAEPLPAGNPHPSEDDLRQARYQFLKRTAGRIGARYLATGHHLDDQAETILFRMLRGTGVIGLAGIPPIRAITPELTLIRPLLEIRRSQLRQLLDELGQAFRNDASNDSIRFRRNFLRREILPQLVEEFGDQVPESLAGLGRQARELEDYLQEVAAPFWLELQWEGRRAVRGQRDRLDAIHPVVLKALLRRVWREAGWPTGSMTRREWNRLVEAIRDPHPEAFHLPGAIEFRGGEREWHLQDLAGVEEGS